jgi:DNA topoisomerase-1
MKAHVRGLIRVDDQAPGIRRLRCGRGFAYRHPDGRPVRDANQLNRIARLAIPPAYTQVWISPLPHGHLQATGRDARGRKQYRYHADWQRVREAAKFARLREFGCLLPRIRRRVAADLAADLATDPAASADGHRAPARNTVLAAVVRLLDTTLVRIGNEEYARSNGSFGLTTLRAQHASVRGTRLRLRFLGKSHVMHEVEVNDAQVAHVVERCQVLPGRELFHYEDDQGRPHCISSTEVNAYLRDAAGANVSAKDFRTWHASVLALALLRRTPQARATQILREVAACLRNTVAVCRKSYVHPAVLRAAEETEPVLPAKPRRRVGLRADEARLLELLVKA